MQHARVYVQEPADPCACAPPDESPQAQIPPVLARDDFSLLLAEVNHRIRNLLAVVEALVGRTQSSTVEGYRSKLMARLAGLRTLQWVIGRSAESTVSLPDLI